MRRALALLLALCLALPASGQMWPNPGPGRAASGGGGGGETLIHSDTFTNTINTILENHDSDWVPRGISELQISGSNNLLNDNVSNEGAYRWTDAGLSTVDYRIEIDLNTGTGTNVFPSLRVRVDTNFNCYLAEWDKVTGAIVLYRVTDNGSTFTEIASGGTVAANTTYTNAYLKVTGTNPVALEAGDDTNGAAAVTFNDSNAARRTSGVPGLGIYTETANSGTLDNLAIYTIP